VTHPIGAIGLGYFDSGSPPTSGDPNYASAVYFWFATTEGDNIVSWDGTRPVYYNSGGAAISNSLTKNPIVIGIPNDDAFGFDIGFAEGDAITISVTNLSSASADSFAMKLKNVIKKGTGVSSGYVNKPMPLIWSDNTFWVLPRSLNIKQEAGQGNMVDLTVTLEIVQWS